MQEIDLKGLSILRPSPPYVEIRGNLVEEASSDYVEARGTTEPPYIPPTVYELHRLPSDLPGQGKRLVYDGRTWTSCDFQQISGEYTRPNSKEIIRLKFQTSRPDGLIWYSGNDRDNTHISLKVNSACFA